MALYQVSLLGPDRMAVFDIKGAQAEFSERFSRGVIPDWPPSFNSITQSADQTLAWIGNDHWLLIAPIEAEAKIAALIGAEKVTANHSMLIVSDAYEFYSIIGPDAHQILSMASTLDIHDSVFLKNAGCFTEFFDVKAFICRIEDGFRIAVDRSYSKFIHDCIAQIL